MSDVASLRQRAEEFDLAARILRTEADQVRASNTVDWTSPTAEQWRDDLLRLLADLHREADHLAEAAAAFRRHADEVQAAQDAAERAFEWFQRQLSGAYATLESGVQAVGEHAHRAAERVVALARSAPSPGSPDWRFW